MHTQDTNIFQKKHEPVGSGFPPLRKLGGNVATGSVYSGLGYTSHGTCVTGILHKHGILIFL